MVLTDVNKEMMMMMISFAHTLLCLVLTFLGS